MPLPGPWSDLKREMRMKIIENPAEALKSLLDWLPIGSGKSDSTGILLGEWNDIKKQELRGTLSNDELQRANNRIRAAALDLIDGMREEDFTVPEKPAPAPKPDPMAPSAMPAEAPANPGIPKFVVVYDAIDQQLCDRLNNHLFVLRSTKKIQMYFVHKAPAGADMVAWAQQEIATAAYILAIITPNLFNDETPWFGMIMQALADGRRVIPIRMQKMDIDGTGLEKLRALPSQNLTVADYGNTDAAYAEIAKEIARLAAG
ncbi:MAG: hypothetical protein IPL65_13730 [Lewinellaceae bacterium]|nr:hypothetical protein [Lewinellaceae bacterium]